MTGFCKRRKEGSKEFYVDRQVVYGTARGLWGEASARKVRQEASGKRREGRD